MNISDIKTLHFQADLGDVDAQRTLGQGYLFGDYGPVDYAKAWKYFSMAAQQRDAYSVYVCGYLVFNGYGAAVDVEKGIKLWNMAADLGSADAMDKLAICYSDGIGVVRDEHKAHELWSKAAELGHPNGLFNQAVDLHNTGVDAAKAGNWQLFVAARYGARVALEKAADAGSKDAQELLINGYGGVVFGADEREALDRAAWNLIRGT